MDFSIEFCYYFFVIIFVNLCELDTNNMVMRNLWLMLVYVPLTLNKLTEKLTKSTENLIHFH